MKPKTEPYSVQIDKELLVKAKKMVNLPDAMRNLVAEITRKKICPCCGNRIKKV